MGKKKISIILILIAAMLVLIGTVSSASISLAATEDNVSEITSDTAELSASKKCTIKKKNGKWYYVNSKGKVVKSKGWKKNSSGKLTYFVNKKGVVTYKITSKGVLKKWNEKKWIKVALKKNSIKKIGGKVFITNAKGKIVRKTNVWKKIKNVKYYLNKKGVATYKIKANKLYKYKSGKWVLVKKNTKVGNTTYKVTSSGTIKKTVSASDSEENVSDEEDLDEEKENITEEDSSEEEDTEEEFSASNYTYTIDSTSGGIMVYYNGDSVLYEWATGCTDILTLWHGDWYADETGGKLVVLYNVKNELYVVDFNEADGTNTVTIDGFVFTVECSNGEVTDCSYVATSEALEYSYRLYDISGDVYGYHWYTDTKSYLIYLWTDNPDISDCENCHYYLYNDETGDGPCFIPLGEGSIYSNLADSNLNEGAMLQLCTTGYNYSLGENTFTLYVTEDEEIIETDITITVELFDYDEGIHDWAESLIDEICTDDMTDIDKLNRVCSYIQSHALYVAGSYLDLCIDNYSNTGSFLFSCGTIFEDYVINCNGLTSLMIAASEVLGYEAKSTYGGYLYHTYCTTMIDGEEYDFDRGINGESCILSLDESTINYSDNTIKGTYANCYMNEDLVTEVDKVEVYDTWISNYQTSTYYNEDGTSYTVIEDNPTCYYTINITIPYVTLDYWD